MILSQTINFFRTLMLRGYFSTSKLWGYFSPHFYSGRSEIFGTVCSNVLLCIESRVVNVNFRKFADSHPSMYFIIHLRLWTIKWTNNVNVKQKLFFCSTSIEKQKEIENWHLSQLEKHKTRFCCRTLKIRTQKKEKKWDFYFPFYSSSIRSTHG